MVMIRHNRWEIAFSNYIREKQSEPFRWGENDCVLFAAKALEVITGINFYKIYLPYGSEEEAKAIMAKFGGIGGLVSRHLGGGHENHRVARRGDLALVRTGSRMVQGYVNGGANYVSAPEETLGIVDDSGERIITLSKNGVVRVPLKAGARFWSY